MAETLIGKIGITPRANNLPSYEILDLIAVDGRSYLSLANNNSVAVTDDTKWLKITDSPYDVAKKLGYAGTEAEWITSLSAASEQAASTANTAITNANNATVAANTAAATANGQAGTYNVTVAVPLTAGSYYTKASARTAVPSGSRLLGRVITYATASGVWYTERFIGSSVSNWTTDANWEYVPSYSDLLDRIEVVEPALAEVLSYLNAKVTSLETFITNSLFKNVQIDSLNIVKALNLFGTTNLILIGTAAPAVVPDFVGQTFINTTAGIIYQAKGNSSSGDWKQTSN